MTLGIGIVTYNRRDVLLGTIERVLRHTRAPFRLVIADDGSTDGTLDALKGNGITIITGRNSGVAWNKNRALYWLAAVCVCDPIILLEDDCRPVADGWEAPFLEAARLWGHVNLAGDWVKHSYVSGSGTPADPILARETGGPCAVFSATALAWVGYLDTRFRGYGYEHVEHTHRFMRQGFGGARRAINGEMSWLYSLIDAPMEMLTVPSSADTGQAGANLALCRQLMVEQTYRPAWRDEAEFHQMRAEIEAARA